MTDIPDKKERKKPAPKPDKSGYILRAVKLTEAEYKLFSDMAKTYGNESNVFRAALRFLAATDGFLDYGSDLFSPRLEGNTTRGENRRGSPKKECAVIS